MPPFSPGQRLVVLGAGATYGAEFENFKAECRPPLNSDFFTQLQKIRSKHRKLVRDVIKDVVELFGPNFSLTLEDYFTQLEFLSEAMKFTPKGAGALTAQALAAKNDRLKAALAATLEISTDVAIRKAGGCKLHKQFVAGLEAKDTVISFNYDCVLDHALKAAGDGKWSARYGYGFVEPARVRGVERWDPGVPAASQAKTIYLLKLHGSLNWQLPIDPQGKVVLKQRLHSQRGVPRFSVIPPVWNKRSGVSPLFDDLWRSAERAIRAAKHVAVAGFSFAPTDLHVESLFRLALANSHLETLVIANPRREDRRRIRQVFARPLERGAVVRQFGGFKEFVEAFPACLG